VYYDQVLRELEVSQPGTFTESRKFIQLCLSLPTSNAAVERGFSQTKMILESRECLSLQYLIAQRVGKEAIHFYGSSSKVPITPSLLSMQFRAYQNHQRRVEEEQKEKKKRDESIRSEREASRKRAAEKADKEGFEEKRKKYETEEKSLSGQLQFDETRLEGVEQRAEKTKSMQEIRSSMAAAKLLREGIKEKQSKLQSVTAKKVKLLESRLNKK
jgi:hypothetical protein